MSGALFIDLGEEWSVVEERQARAPRRPDRRALLAALLLLVVLPLAGGSAVTTSPLTPLATIHAPGVTLARIGGGGVFLAGGTGTALFVARYGQETGVMTWKVAVPDRPDSLAYLAGAEVVTLWFYGQQGPNRVTVLDAATGVRLWELSGDLYGPATRDGKRALTVAGDPNAPGQARYVELRTGRAIWTRPVPAGTQIVTVDAQLPSEAAGAGRDRDTAGSGHRGGAGQPEGRPAGAGQGRRVQHAGLRDGQRDRRPADRGPPDRRARR
jgi:hypothetical protein